MPCGIRARFCGSLVSGAEFGKTEPFTIYAGSLDDPTPFRPTVAIFTGNRPAWTVIPFHHTVFGEMPL